MSTKNISTTAGFNPSGGGFAEYVKVPILSATGAISIPTEVSFEQASLWSQLTAASKRLKPRLPWSISYGNRCWADWVDVYYAGEIL